MRWTTKAFIQRTAARLPFGPTLYYLGQRHAGGLRDFTIAAKVRQALALLDAFSATGGAIAGALTVEWGTGRAPVLPLLFWLLGQGQGDTYDVARLLRPSLVEETARQLAAMTAAPEGAPLARVASDVRTDRRQRLTTLVAQRRSAAAILNAAGIVYHAPVDTAVSGLPDHSVDIVYSNTVLEHVPESELPRLLREARRILRPGGRLLHQIDPSDHFAHADRRLSPIHFLRYSPEAYERYNSRLFYQNRLRAPTYRALLEMHGFDVLHWETDVNARAMAQLSDQPLHHTFAHYSPEALCTTGIRLVAAPAG